MTDLTLSAYMIERFKQLGIQFIQGVPGDFNLALLTRLREGGLDWVGNTNELNAGYSADGLARVLAEEMPRPSVITTTFGVGELSACNALGGSMAERLPVIHIVGTPSTKAQDEGLLLHHTLGDHKFDAFLNMARQITSKQLDYYLLYREGRLVQRDDADGTLVGGDDAAREFDATIEHCLVKSLPVYVALPSNLVDYKLPAESARRLQIPLNIDPPPNDEDQESSVLAEILVMINEAKLPVLIIDACAKRHNVSDEIRELVEESGLMFFATPMGKGCLAEQNESHFGGIYHGDSSNPVVKGIIENQADLVISIGSLLSDYNTNSFSYRTRKSHTIELHSTYTEIGFARYEGVGFKYLLPKISAGLRQYQAERWGQTRTVLSPAYASLVNRLPTPEEDLNELDETALASIGGAEGYKEKDPITQAYLWPRVGNFFRQGDVILGETGTSVFGLMDVTFPPNVHWLSQVLWGSIGYTGGAVLGAALGLRQLKKEDPERPGRTIQFIGDGSLQLTVQEISTVIRHGLTPLIFVLNNDGYEIERQIFGVDESYNDVARWNHAAMLDFFSAPPEYVKPDVPSHANDPTPSKTAYYAVHTKKELDHLLDDRAFNRADKCTVIEVFLPRGDCPPALKRQAAMSRVFNEK